MVADNSTSSNIDEITLLSRIERFLQSSPYHPCLLLVHHEITRLQAASEQLRKHYNWPEISIGAMLSIALFPIAPAKRPRQARRIISTTVSEQRPGPLLCTDIDLLFEPSLSLDPLRLLRQSSRQLALVVIWPGTYEHDVLAHAVPKHGHYRTWPQPDLCDACIVPL